MESSGEERIRFRERCEEAVEDYLSHYFSSRDIGECLKRSSGRLTGFGPGLDDGCFSFDQSLELLKRDFSRFPSGITCIVRQQRISPLSDDLFICMALLDLTYPTADQVGRRQDGLRMTLIVRLLDDGYLIEHMHASVPTDGETVTVRKAQSGELLSGLEGVLEEYHVQDIQSAYHELEVMLSIDVLTGLRSRLRMDELLVDELKRASRYDTTFSLIMVDLDDFKLVNDSFGHLFGDYILKRFGKLLQTSLRETDAAGRWGGDEFILMLPQTDEEHALLVMRKLLDWYGHDTLESYMEQYRLDHPDLELGCGCERLRRELTRFPFSSLSFSYGITEYQVSDTIPRMVNRADLKLFRMKCDKKSD